MAIVVYGTLGAARVTADHSSDNDENRRMESITTALSLTIVITTPIRMPEVEATRGIIVKRLSRRLTHCAAGCA